MSEATAPSRKVKTGVVTLSYPALLVPQKPQEGSTGKDKYGATLVYAPGSDLSRERIAAIQAGTEKFGATMKIGGKTYSMADIFDKGLIRSPFRTDAEAKGYAEGSTFINAKSESKPQVVWPFLGENGKVKTMTDEEIAQAMYPGCQCKASITAFAYDVSGNKGFAFALNSLQRLGEGPRLDSRVNAEDEFEADLNAVPDDISHLVG
jgi:hypothetical protein